MIDGLVTGELTVNPTKLFSLYNRHFSVFIVELHKKMHYFLMLQTLKLNNQNRKNEEIKDW
jgi:hypothetical protein